MLRFITCSLILTILTISPAVANDLFLVEINSATDADLLRNANVDPIHRGIEGYLVIADGDGEQRLGQLGLTFRIIAKDVTRENLALDTRPDNANVERFPLIYDKGSFRLYRVSTAALKTTDDTPPELFPIGNRSPRIVFAEQKHINKSAFTAESMTDLTLLINEVRQDSLYSYVSGLQAYGRVATSIDNKITRDILVGKLQGFGYDSVVVDSFDAYFSGGWRENYNVLAYKVGTTHPDKHIVVGAHRDAVPGSPGADDNGSGTAGVLEIARVMADVETDMTIVFALFDAEEYGLHGSWHYADRASATGEDIELMLNMDMIGHFDNNSLANLFHGPVTAYAEVWQILADATTGVTGVLAGNSGGSDHYPFIQNGYEAFFVAEFNFSTVYHSFRDSTSYQNFDYMTKLVKASLGTVVVVDQGLFFSGSSRAGYPPHTVEFDAWSRETASTWNWDFSDGGSSTAQAPTHTFTERGLYDVSLEVNTTGGPVSIVYSDYIAVVDDTIFGPIAGPDPSRNVEVLISANHILPLRKLTIPIEYAGNLTLVYDSFSTAGLQTENWGQLLLSNLDPNNERLTLTIGTGGISGVDLAPGTNTVVKVYFSATGSLASGLTTSLDLSGYSSSFMPLFYATLMDYTPNSVPILVSTGCCSGIRGDVNGDGAHLDIVDLTCIVDYLFGAGCEMPCADEANVNGDDSNGPDIVDLTYLVDWLFGTPPALVGCS